jgi:hypothetical protein
VERRLAVKFIRQRENLTFVWEHGTWSQRATADRNSSLTELVTYILMSKEWKVLLESNSNFECDKTILQINHKAKNVKLKIKCIPPPQVFRHFIRLSSGRIV